MISPRIGLSSASPYRFRLYTVNLANSSLHMEIRMLGKQSEGVASSSDTTIQHSYRNLRILFRQKLLHSLKHVAEHHGFVGSKLSFG